MEVVKGILGYTSAGYNDEASTAELKIALKNQEHSMQRHIDNLSAELATAHVSSQKDELCREELADVKKQLKSSKADLVQERGDAERESQAAAAAAEKELADLKRQLVAIKSNNATLNTRLKSSMQEVADTQQQSQADAAVSERKVADLKQQLGTTKSAYAALVEESADARQKSKATAAAAERELVNMKEKLDVTRSNNSVLSARLKSSIQEVADEQQQSQAEAAAARRKIADLKQQLGTTKSDNAVLVQKNADVKQKLKAVTAAAEKDLADVKQQLAVMKSNNSALDARLKSSMQEVADAQQQSQADAAVAEKKVADLEQQLGTTKSAHAALVQNSADAEQKFHAAAAAAKRELADMTQKLNAMKSNNSALSARLKSSLQDVADAHQQSQAEAAAAESKVADLKQQLSTTKSAHAVLVEENTNAKQKSQDAAAVVERALADMKQHLVVMKSNNSALDARWKSSMQEVADVGQQAQTTATAAKQLPYSRQPIAVTKSSNAALAQDRAGASQTSQVATAVPSNDFADVKQQLHVMKSSNSALDPRMKPSMQEVVHTQQQPQTTATEARQLLYLRQQLDITESSNAALVQDSADLGQKSQAVPGRDFMHVQQLHVMKSNNSPLDIRFETLMQEVVDMQRRSQAMAAAAERKIADLQQQLDVTKSCNAVLVQENADARQKSQTAAAAAERELVDVRQQLDVMKSNNSALDVQLKALLRERAEAQLTIQCLRDEQSAQAFSQGMFSSDSFQDVVDQVLEPHVSFTGHPSVERLNDAIDEMVLEALEALDALAAQGDSAGHMAVKPPTLDRLGPLFASLAKCSLTEEDRGFLFDACLHNLVVPFLYDTFFQSVVSTIAVDEDADVLDKIFSNITVAGPWAACQWWRAITASATATMFGPVELDKQARHIEEQVSRSIAWAYGQSLAPFHPIRAKLLQNITSVMHDAHKLSLVLKRDILSVQMMVVLDKSIDRPYDPRFEGSVWPEMGAKAGDSVIGVYGLGLRKVTPTGQIVDIIQPKVVTDALLREIERLH